MEWAKMCMAGAGVLLAALAAEGCTDSVDPAFVTLPGRPASVAATGVYMKGYHFDAPAPRPWDLDPAALDSALTSANGRLIVSFKNPASKHALLGGHGFRADLQADDFELGVNKLAALGASIERLWPGNGDGAGPRVSRGGAGPTK